MLWPLELPVGITFWLFTGLVGLATVLAPFWKWKRGQTFAVSVLLAGLLFIPSCMGIMAIVDPFRFGSFQYASYSDVNDFRVERFLPATAKEISLRKYPNGHEARYSISEADLKDFIDGLWKISGGPSPVSREGNDGQQSKKSGEVGSPSLAQLNFELKFQGLGWPTPESLIEIAGPRESDGGGADYFYDPVNQIAYHSGSYW